MISERLKEDFDKLQETKEFKDYKKENPKAYFASAFLMIENLSISDVNWQIDYYDPETHKASTFAFNGDNVDFKTGEELLQKKKEDIDKISLDDIKLNFDKIIEIIHKFRERKYKEEKAQKIIIILQKFKNHIIWNITYITFNLNLLNFKVNAVNGKVIENKMQPLIKFDPKSLKEKKK